MPCITPRQHKVILVVFSVEMRVHDHKEITSLICLMCLNCLELAPTEGHCLLRIESLPEDVALAGLAALVVAMPCMPVVHPGEGTG